MKLMRWAAVLLLFPLPLVMRSLAADWPPISPKELSMTSVPEVPGAPAVILYREQTDDDINHHHHIYVRMKILREGDAELAEVQVPFNSGFYHIGDINGRTVHPDGSITPFAVTSSEKLVSRGQGVFLRTTGFTLPDMQVGSIIDYQYDVRYVDYVVKHNMLSDRTYFFSPPEWIVQDKLFQKKAVFKFYPMRTNTYEGYFVKDKQLRGAAWSSYLPSNQPQPQAHQILSHATSMEIETDLKRPSEYIDLQLTNIPPVSNEPYMPPANLLRWRVTFYYVTEDKKEDFWKSQERSWNNRTNDFVGSDHGVRDAVSQLVSSTDTAQEKVHKLYNYVTKLDNWSFTSGQAQQEEHTPNQNAGDVLEHKGGTHDDLNGLFVSMVHAAGLPGYVIWVPDRSQHLFDDNFLSTQQFEAEIAIVQLDGKELFLDPGSKFCPFGMIDWRYSGSRGLRQTAQGPGLCDTPSSNYNQSIVTRGANLELASDGSAEGNVTLTFMGLQAMGRRQEGGKTDIEGRKKLLEGELKKLLLGNSEISLTGQPDWENSETPLVAKFKVKVLLAVSAGKRWTVTQHLFQVSETARFSAGQRLQPIYFDYPWHEVDEIHITLPAGMETESLAPDASLRLDYALYKSQQKQESPNKIFSRRELVMASGGIPATNYKDVKNFFDSVKTGDDQTALVKLSQNVATAK